MPEAGPTPDAAFDDLTARARIRNVALAHFAERGAKATTIRGVAHDAAVSPGLVQHHFGTKDGLRQACDAYVSEYLRRGVKQGVTERAIGDPGFLAATYQSAPTIMRYLARSLIDDSPAAAAMFDEIVAQTEHHLTGSDSETADTRGQAAVFAAMKLGVVVLHQHLSRALGTDSLAPAGLARIGKAMLAIVSPALVGDDLSDAARTGIDEYLKHNPTPTTQTPDPYSGSDNA
jgi:AcrR family transcriptional regulator